MIARVILLSAALVGILSLAGCGPAKLDVSKTYTIDAGGAQPIDLDPQSKPQTITVDYESSDGEVRVGVFNAADAGNIDSIQFSKAIKEEKGQKGTLQADVPANTATRIVVEGRLKKTEVKLHITNR